MKQCPRCKRTYSDETLLYCLDDGSALGAAYDPEATQVMPDPRITNQPSPPVSPVYPPPPYPPAPFPPQRRSQWPVYLLVVLLLLVVSGGAVTLLIFGYSRLQDSASGRLQSTATPSPQPQYSQSPNFPFQSLASPSPTVQVSAAASPTPQSRQLVGTWRTNVIENNERVEITYTFSADGTSRAVFKDREGQTETHYGSWRYSDPTLFETFPDGAKGKGAIRWIDDDNFEITIIDNGVPLYSGLKRRYRRINDAGTE